MVITVKDFIEENPYASIDVMNHKGVARLPVGLAQSLLTPSCQRTKLKVNGAGDTILASELLECVVTKVIRNRKKYNHVFLLTSTKAAAAQSDYRPQLEFEQLEFDLSDLPQQWLQEGSNPAPSPQPKQEVPHERRKSKHPW